MAKKPKLVQPPAKEETPAPAAPTPEVETPEPTPEATPAPTPEPTATPETETEEEVEPDYRDLYGQSTREFQVLNERKKTLEAEIALLTSNAPPTDEEMMNEYPEWEIMSEMERRFAKTSFVQQRKVNRMELEREHEKLEAANRAAFRAVIATNPEIASRRKEFEEYMAKPTHKGVALEVLVKAFLHDTKPPAAGPSNGAALMPGSGGPKDQPKPKAADGTISAEQAKELRMKDPKRYLQLAKAGKIRYE